MAWAQYTLIVLSLIGFGIHLARAGQDIGDRRYFDAVYIISGLLSFFLLLFAGGFDKVFGWPS